MVWGGVACTQPTEPEAPVEPTKYTISFDSGVESITVEKGAVATKPTDPEKTGYTFGGWLNGKAAYDWTQPVTSDLSLTAKWTAVAYTITYLPEGVEKDTYIKSYTIESDAIVLDTNPTSPDATKPNFVAWHDGEKPTEGEWVEIKEIAKGSTGNKIIVAEFSDKEQITITFKGDYTGTKNVEKDSTFAGLTGYDLFYEDGKAFDTTKAIDAAITLTAKAKEFKVTFDSGVASQTIKYNCKATEPTAPTKEGFDFVDWYEGETKFDFATKITKDISLTAKWEEKKAEDPTTPPASGESINPVLWEGEEAVSTGNWAASVSIDAKNFAGLTSGYALKVTYNDDPDSTTYEYHQFGFKSAPEGEDIKLEGVDVTLNDWGCFELPTGGTYCYHPLSEKDITSLKTNGLNIGGYGVVISKVELKKYTNIVIDSSKNYTCFGGGEGELTTATPITISEDLGIGKPFSYETVLKIVDTKQYSNGGVIFDFEIPEGKSLADYSIEGLFYFPRVGDDIVGYDDSMYYKNVCLYAGTTLTENGYMEALASVSTVWNSNNAWKSFAPIAAEGKEESLAALKGNVQFAIGMNSDKGTYYLAKVTIYEK